MVAASMQVYVRWQGRSRAVELDGCAAELPRAP
jgi:hypothetical protein